MVLTLTFIFLIYFDKNYLMLEAVDIDTDALLCSKIIKKGSNFTLKFQNSISKTMAEEKFDVLDIDSIRLTEFRYQSCDAGFPSGINSNFSIIDDYMIIKDINQIFSKIDNYRIAIKYPHYLLIGKSKCNLSEKAAGHVLLIRVKKIF